MDYGSEVTKPGYEQLAPRAIPLLERLQRQRDEVAQRLAELTEAIEMLQKQPELERLLSLLRNF